MIGVRRLRLQGLREDYEVSFCDDKGKLLSLSIIAGEITTGKTAVLEFIDYCLGQSDHPSYVEIERQARSAQLEVDLSGEIHVIERPLFGSEGSAWLHQCTLKDMDRPHATSKLPIGPAGEPRSLNWLLLAHSNLEGVVLKEAPTQAVTETDPLSFRDVMWLAFLDSDRMLSKNLLHDSNVMKRLKLKQLVEVVFGIHDQQMAAMGDRIRLLEKEREDQKAEIQSLQTFLKEQEVPDRLEVQAAIKATSEELEPLELSLKKVSERMRAASNFAESVRERYSVLRREAGQASARIRDREALLKRLLPLHAQYAEDERKLVFFTEAQQLFDPMRVSVCPSCLSDLEELPEIKDARCTLCDALVESKEEQINVEAERAAIRTRLRAVGQYIEEVERDLTTDRSAYQRVAAEESAVQAELDSDMSERLSPFVAQRDELVRRISAQNAEIADLERQLGWLESVDRRSAELDQLQSRIEALREEQRELEEHRPSRDVVIRDLSDRFEQLLRAFGFPKLDDPEPPYLDRDLVPYVRGSRYDKIGSRGAVTLIALAWELAIFERAVETGSPHPGFLMIDSPQANLKPSEGKSDEYSTAEIGGRLWHHLAEWSQGAGRNTQLIVVDHTPPVEVRASVVITFSGDPEQPPYGLIANETGES